MARPYFYHGNLIPQGFVYSYNRNHQHYFLTQQFPRVRFRH